MWRSPSAVPILQASQAEGDTQVNEPFLGPVTAGTHPGNQRFPLTPSFLLPLLSPPEFRKQRSASLNVSPLAY